MRSIIKKPFVHGYLAKLIGGRRRGLVGVDISPHRVRLLELARQDAGYYVSAFASETLPADAVHDFQIHDAAAVARTVKSALERSGTRSRDAAIAVAGPDVISKIVALPRSMDDLEMEQQIHADAMHHLSHSTRDVVIDFQVLGPDHKDADLNRVLLVACRRETIETYTGALEMAGMTVALVDVEEYALQNACDLLTQDAPAVQGASARAVFDIGAHDTRLTIQDNDQNHYARRLALGSRAFSAETDEAWERSLQLAADDAMRSPIRAPSPAFARQLSTMVERALSFYASVADDGGVSIAEVLIAGEIARHPGLIETIQSQCRWPVATGNPLAGMTISAAAERHHCGAQAPALMVATGLALRGVA